MPLNKRQHWLLILIIDKASGDQYSNSGLKMYHRRAMKQWRRMFWRLASGGERLTSACRQRPRSVPPGARTASAETGTLKPSTGSEAESEASPQRRALTLAWGSRGLGVFTSSPSVVPGPRCLYGLHGNRARGLRRVKESLEKLQKYPGIFLNTWNKKKKEEKNKAFRQVQFFVNIFGFSLG